MTNRASGRSLCHNRSDSFSRPPPSTTRPSLRVENLGARDLATGWPRHGVTASVTAAYCIAGPGHLPFSRWPSPGEIWPDSPRTAPGECQVFTSVCARTATNPEAASTRTQLSVVSSAFELFGSRSPQSRTARPLSRAGYKRQCFGAPDVLRQRDEHHLTFFDARRRPNGKFLKPSIDTCDR